MKTLDTDFLVVGTGLSGLIAAHRLSAQGEVLLVSKTDAPLSNTQWAQGGICCVMDEEDSFAAHVEDTVGTGGALCSLDTVREIVSAAPGAIDLLIELGVQFDEGEDGARFDLGKEGGHQYRRVLHAGDITGRELIRVLLSCVVKNPRVRLMEHCMAIDLVTTGWLGESGVSRCVGAYFLERSSGAIFAVRAGHTVLATGGAGKVYVYTTNPDVATGDGMAMAWRAGLPMHNMEFVQFHPTCLFHPEAKSFLISEAVRGEGGVLINADGEPFMEGHDERGSLAPRDIVARAIDGEMKRRGDVCVFLDITHRSRVFLERRFPTILATCAGLGIDMAREPIPVVPAAHYYCGGVKASVSGETELGGLSVVGEASCTGLHGANRLASNSLLEALVCARKMSDRLGRMSIASEPHIDIPKWQFGDAVASDEAVVVEHNWEEVRRCMWDYVGIVRTDKRLERAFRRIRTIRMEIQAYYLDYLVTSDMLELRNISAIAELIVRSAQMRKESRGLHYTLDYLDKLSRTSDTVIQDDPRKAKEALLESGFPLV